MRDRILKALEHSGADDSEIRVEREWRSLIGLSDRAEWHFGILNTPAIAIDGVGVASQG